LAMAAGVWLMDPLPLPLPGGPLRLNLWGETFGGGWATVQDLLPTLAAVHITAINVADFSSHYHTIRSM
jgi:hypothetical protein